MFVIVVVTLSYVLPLGGGWGRLLRLARVMAPMLELMRNDGLATLVKTFLLSMPAVGAILLLLFILYAVFGIIGVEYFGGRLYRCVYANDMYSVVPLSEVVNRTQCVERADTLWQNPPYDFDNILTSSITLFYMCINSGWAEIMEATLDITEVDEQPVLNNSKGFWVYFVFFHIIFSLFMLNIHRCAELCVQHTKRLQLNHVYATAMDPCADHAGPGQFSMEES